MATQAWRPGKSGAPAGCGLGPQPLLTPECHSLLSFSFCYEMRGKEQIWNPAASFVSCLLLWSEREWSPVAHVCGGLSCWRRPNLGDCDISRGGSVQVGFESADSFWSTFKLLLPDLPSCEQAMPQAHATEDVICSRHHAVRVRRV